MRVWHSIRFIAILWLDFVRYYIAGLRNGFSTAYFRAQIPIWAHRMLTAAGVELEVLGLEHVGPGPYLIASNHQGNLDIPALFAAFKGLRTTFVMKAELLEVPIGGRLFKAAGMIPIKRGDKRQALAAIEEALRQIGPGDAVIMFPEGTRTKTGQMGRAKRGVFYFSLHTGLPILPVAITGSFERFPKDRFLSINPGPIRVEILPPIQPDPDGGDDHAALMMERWEAVLEQAIGLDSQAVRARLEPA